ncbi:MAG: adenylate kinase [candidate division KSB1 bacterium]|nr:adenylate kinase [candidate division KSB1 bacterium]MDZ7301357.1 adenylate kinase [candidate division KSB1 bacterium]MDZ7310758.1 adenylate kinase [candidate division KSB1 bacterium]
MELIFIGYPGSGKGTQASLLSQRFNNIPKISTGDILRAAVAAKTKLGAQAKRYLDAGELVPDEVMIDLVIQRLSEPDAAKGYILDGFPRTMPQARELDRVLHNLHRQISAVISLEIGKEEVMKRLTSRRVCARCGRLYNLLTDPPPEDNVCLTCGGEVRQRSDDKPETVLHRLEVYEETTRPLKAYYEKQSKLIQIDGSLSPDKVHAEIVHQLLMKQVGGLKTTIEAGQTSGRA